jgi:Nuclear protein 96/Nucleoporin autopeptidase
MFGAMQQQQPAPVAPMAANPAFYQPVANGMIFPAGTQIMPPATNEVLDQQLRALDAQREELEKRQSWNQNGGANGNTRSNESWRGLSTMDANGPLYHGATTYRIPSPRTSVRVRPRGFPQSEPVRITGRAATSSRDSQGLMPVDPYVKTSVMRLEIRPDAIPKPPPRLRLLLSATKASPPPPAVAALPEPAVTTPRPRASPADTIDAVPTEEPTPNASATTHAATPDAATTPETKTPKSPAQAYYDKIVGLNDDDSSPVPMRGSAVPILTKAGYQVLPPLDVLREMSPVELATVSNFSVTRAGYGKIEWVGSVDVRQANLDEIVVIERQDVSVYTLAEERGNKPGVGEKLNRPAVITFYNIFPKNGPHATTEEMDRFIRKVERAASKSSAQHLSYDGQLGEWKIRVEHFSRYGLFDDDSDAENVEMQPPRATPLQHGSLREANRPPPATPFWDPALEKVTDHYRQVADLRMDDDTELRWAHHDADTAMYQLRSVTTTAMSVEEEPEMVPEDVYEADTPALVAPYRPSREEMAQAAQLPQKVCQDIFRGKSSVDMGLRMGKSFRVSFGVDNTLRQTCWSSAKPLLKVICPQLSTWKYSVLLEKLVSHGIVETRPFLHFRLPLAASNGGTMISQGSLCEILRFFAKGQSMGNATSAFKLILSMVDACGNDSVHLAGRKRAAVGQLLREECAEKVENDLATTARKQDHVSAFLSAFSSGGLDSACGLAMKAGHSELAVILATCPSSRKDMADQINQYQSSGNISSLSSPLQRLLRGVAGEASAEQGPLVLSTGSSLDWRQRLALRLLQEPELSLSDHMQRYQGDIGQGLVPPPLPKSAGKATQESHALLYRLLRLLATGCEDVSVMEAIDPSGFTSEIHDHGISFLLAALLDASGLAKVHTDEMATLVDSFAGQLCQEGRWEWAVVVTLFVGAGTPKSSILNRKELRARELVSRCYTNSSDDQKRRSFLEASLRIPTVWFDAVLAERSVVRGDMLDYVKHSIAAGDVQKALLVLDNQLLPQVFFTSKDKIKGMLIDAQIVARSKQVPEKCLSLAIYLLIVLEEQVALLRSRATVSQRLAVYELRSIQSDVEEILRYHESVDGGSQVRIKVPFGGLAPSSPEKAIPWKDLLVAEAKLQLKYLCERLESLDSSAEDCIMQNHH